MGTPAGEAKVRPVQPPGLARGLCASPPLAALAAFVGASPADCSSATFR
jgi:hypothetical protein